MKFSRIIFLIVFSLFLISCRNGSEKQHNIEPKRSTVPSTEYKKPEESAPKPNTKKLLKKPFNKKVKKKKQRAIDTLKPLVTIP